MSTPAMPWAKYAAQPAEGGDAKPWEKYAAAPSTQNTPPSTQNDGFFASLGHAFGVGSEEDQARIQKWRDHPLQSIAETQPPVQAAEGLWNGAKRVLGEVGQAGSAALHGNAPEAALHGIAALPFVGPGLIKASEQAPASTPGESYLSRVQDAATDPGVEGTVLGTAAQAAPVIAGGLTRSLPEAPENPFPTRAKAGALFENVMQDAGDQPVKLTRAMEPLERAQQLSARGGGTVGAVDNLYKRINTINPLDYREARDWASNLSRLTAQDSMSSSPALKAQVGKLSHAFNEDIGDTAASVGRGEDYAKAMRDYRRASMFNNAAKTTAKWAIPAAVGGGLAGTALKKVMQ